MPSNRWKQKVDSYTVRVVHAVKTGSLLKSAMQPTAFVSLSHQSTPLTVSNAKQILEQSSNIVLSKVEDLQIDLTGLW
jgi:hypothetical protein